MKWPIGRRFGLVVTATDRSLVAWLNHYNSIPCPWHRVLGRIGFSIHRTPQATLLTVRLSGWNRTWQRCKGEWPVSLGNDELIQRAIKERIERAKAGARMNGRPVIMVITDWAAQCICKANPSDWPTMIKPPSRHRVLFDATKERGQWRV